MIKAMHTCRYINDRRLLSSQEHAGNDPTTQLVPTSGGSGTWTKPEEETPLTVSSNWASSSGPWQPPATVAPVPAQPVRVPVDRMLNPAEYPTLGASSKADGSFTGIKSEQAVRSDIFDRLDRLDHIIKFMMTHRIHDGPKMKGEDFVVVLTGELHVVIMRLLYAMFMLC